MDSRFSRLVLVYSFLAFVVLLQGCEDSGGGSASTPDTTAPSLVSGSVQPSDTATGVEIATTLSATFDEAVKAATVDTTSFTVTRTSDSSAVTGTVTLSNGDTVATFTPAAPLELNTDYTVSLSTAITDAANNAFAGITWTFKTKAIFPRYVYVPNFNSDVVSTYRVDGTTGDLNYAGGAPTGTGPVGIAIHPSGDFAYVVNQTSNNVFVYSVDKGRGTLTVKATIGAGTEPTSIVVDPSGKFAYVTNQTSSDISVFTIDQSTGTLTADASATTGIAPQSITIEPTGKFAYVANATSSNVAVFSVDPTTGALGNRVFVTAGTTPSAITFTPSGAFAYVANSASNNISVFSVDTSTGALTEVGTPIATGTSPHSVAVDLTGKYAYVANKGSDNVSVFSIDQTTGTLTEVGTPVSAGTAPTAVAVTPMGDYVYVSNSGSNDVMRFSVDTASGALTKVSEVYAHGGPSGITVTVSNNPVTLASKFLYAANYTSGDVSVYAIDKDIGTLSFVESIANPGKNVSNIMVNPAGTNVYTVNYGNITNSSPFGTISVYSINASTGSLTTGTSTDVGMWAKAGAVDSTGRYIVTGDTSACRFFPIDQSTGEVGPGTPSWSGCSSGNTYAISADPLGKYMYYALSGVTSFSLDPFSGALTMKSNAVVPTPQDMAVHPSGQFLFATIGASSTTTNGLVYVYSLNSSTGVASQVSSANTEIAPLSIALDPPGRFAYVANYNSNSVSVYTFDQATGTLTEVGTPVAVGTQPKSLDVDATGHYLYVANYGSNDIWVYLINQTTGSLSLAQKIPAGTNPKAIAVADYYQ